MLPGVGLTEMLLLVIIGLVVVGPKDLPLMMRKVGKFTGKVRSLAFEFRQSFDELGRQAELEELRKEVADLKKTTGLADFDKEVTEETRKMQREMSDALSDSANEMGKVQREAEAEKLAAPDAELGESGAENRIGGADAEAAEIAADAADARAKAKQDTPA